MPENVNKDHFSACSTQGRLYPKGLKKVEDGVLIIELPKTVS